MTFAKLIHILNLLDHDKEIVVIRKSVLEQEDEYDRVTSFSKYDEVGEYMEYITDTSDSFKFFTLDSDGFVDKKITDEGLED